MMGATSTTLRLLAALTWQAGGLVLLWKGSALLLAAAALRPGTGEPFEAGAAGVAVGLLKARFVFLPSCRRNLDRIAALTQPRLWQFFRPWFFVALGAMIAGGATLSRLAAGHYGGLLFVGALDLTIATGLLASAYLFYLPSRESAG